MIPWLAWLALAGCAADLLPGERVLPGEVPAETLYGGVGSELGTALAVEGERWIVTAPGDGAVHVYSGESLEGTLERRSPVAVWFDDGEPTAAFREDGIYRVLTGERVQETPDARVFAGGDGIAVAASDTQVRALDGRTWEIGRVQALAVGEGRILALSCEAGCQAVELLESAAAVLGPAGDLGRVALWEGQAWWSDPIWERDDGEGVVYSEAGDRIEGLPGDHLGRSIGGGYAVGALNPGSAPVRARIAPLDPAREWLAVDRARETRPLTLAGDDRLLLVGVPQVPDGQFNDPQQSDTPQYIGAVHRVDREDLP